MSFLFIGSNEFSLPNRKKKDPYAEEDEDEEDKADAEEETFGAFMLTLLRNMSASTASVVASHPFHVIAVRTMAQFIGQEQKYTSVYFIHFTFF